LYEWDWNEQGHGLCSASIQRYLKFLKDENKEYMNNPKNVSLNNKINTKNIILYGSPGVGKTHNYKNIISMIEEGDKTEKEIFDSITTLTNKEVSLENDIFEKIKDEKRVEFVTFHQNYSYEDFIEGFRPNEDGKIILEDGIFKRLSIKAEENMVKSVDTNKLVFTDALSILLNKVIEENKRVKINLKKDNSYYEIYDFNNNTLYYTRQGKHESEKYHTLSLSTLKQMYNEEENNVIVGGLSTYYNPLFEKLLTIGKNKIVKKQEEKNFYLVIDEINRGNISKIFGELITLIEEDKRDDYEVTLPYSKEKFKVPANLYIIATMNSTDKSISTIDIALRRRFTFLKMSPNEGLVKDLEAKKLMNSLNKFIDDTLGEDYKLGHSYFMKVNNSEDLEFVKKYKIKPLLEEYFYSDDDNFGKILEVLEGKQNV
jgi:5-methylcytosine-specific restriction protein B